MRTLSSLSIAFDDLGHGEPAVLMMPGWCSNRSAFQTLVQLLSEHRRALALDWRGHGGSDRPDEDFGTAELVDDAISVMETAGLERVVPVASSHAGWVAIELRRRLGPQRVPGIVLLDWMVLGPPPSFSGALAGLQDPDSWQVVRSGLFGMWTEGVDNPALDRNISEMSEYGFDMWSRAGREINAAFQEAGTPVAALERLDPAPTLHLYAQPSAPEFLEAQEHYAGEQKWFSVRRLDAASHFPMFEVPEAIAVAVEEFISRSAAAGPTT